MTPLWIARRTGRRLARGLSLAALLLLVVACDRARCGRGLEAVTIAGHTFCLELSADLPSRGQGLMNRQSIAEEGGMLFVFPGADIRSFWMANCLVDIDLIFLDPMGRVTATHRMVTLPPRRADEPVLDYERRARAQSYFSRLPAQFAVELKSGWLDRLGVAVDDKIELDLARLKASAR